MFKNYQDQQKKISYIDRVNMEKSNKIRNEKKVYELRNMEQELLEKLKKSQDLLRTRRHGEGLSMNQSKSDMNFKSL